MLQGFNCSRRDCKEILAKPFIHFVWRFFYLSGLAWRIFNSRWICKNSLGGVSVCWSCKLVYDNESFCYHLVELEHKLSRPFLGVALVQFFGYPSEIGTPTFLRRFVQSFTLYSFIPEVNDFRLNFSTTKLYGGQEASLSTSAGFFAFFWKKKLGYFNSI